MEKLHIQKKGSIAIKAADIDYGLDERFKPGLFLQTKAFLEEDHGYFVTIAEQDHVTTSFYNQLANYS